MSDKSVNTDNREMSDKRLTPGREARPSKPTGASLFFHDQIHPVGHVLQIYKPAEIFK